LKKILIIYPHFPPSNLAGVHRARLFAQHLPSFDWEPIILTVHEKFYEETPDWNLVKLLPANLRIEKVKALPITRRRLLGDIGLRAFFSLYKKAKQIIESETIDFLYIPIPSFYCALLGRRLHASTGIKYGIDYIDPWVHFFPGSEKVFSRHWLSTRLAMFLEPMAVKKASLITGVAAGYYEAVLKRNPHLQQQAVVGAMPYGGEQQDHALLDQLNLSAYLFRNKEAVLQLVYAGAMLPKAYTVLEAVFKSISGNLTHFEKVEFHFIGTGKTPNDPNGYNIKPLAEKYGLWQSVVYEYPKRIPYLDVLIHLKQADAVYIMGSTEPHYTPSKSYQAILSHKPVLAILHEESTAVKVLKQSNAAIVLAFKGEQDINSIEHEFVPAVQAFKHFIQQFQPQQINMSLFEQYSAKAVTHQLAQLLNKAVAL
jgi:hypothetical protein